MPEQDSSPTPPDEMAPLTEPVLPASANIRRSARFAPSDPMQSQRVLLLTVRLLFLVFLIVMTLVPFVGSLTKNQDEVLEFRFVGPLIAACAVGILVLLVDAATPRKRLASVFGIYLGIVAGLVAALVMGKLVDLVADSWNLRSGSGEAYLNMIKLALGIIFCYLAVSIVLTTKDDFRLVIPYVEFSKQVRGVRPIVLDTSSLIDGRIEQLSQTGFLDAPLILPQFVIDELQALADSSDKLKRERGRRGLGVVSKLQQSPHIDLTLDTRETPDGSVDHKLLNLASEQQFRILTTDYNLDKVAEIRNVSVLNLHDVANTLKAQAIPGEHLSVEVIRVGESASQGVGYMPDGTMIVVEGAAPFIGERVTCTVTNLLQTGAGRMIFGKLDHEGLDANGAASNADDSSTRLADAATSQERITDRPAGRPSGPQGSRPSSRNPRRSS